MTHLTITADALPSTPIEIAIREAHALARRLHCGVQLRWQGHQALLLPGVPLAAIQEDLAVRWQTPPPTEAP